MADMLFQHAESSLNSIGDAAVLAQNTQEANSPAPEKKTRSKHGCLVCRSRRVKCDYTRPQCLKCEKHGSECVYPEIKRFDAQAVTSKLASRHKKQSGSPSASSSPLQQLAPTPSSSNLRATRTRSSLRHTDLESQQEQRMLAVAESEFMPDGLLEREEAAMNAQTVFTIDELMTFFRPTQMGSYYRQPIEPPDFLRPIFPDADDLRCFHHCVTYSFSICVTREEFNPWVQHIAPLFLFPDGTAPNCAQAVKYAMLSTGAAHLSYLDHRNPSTADDGTYWRKLSELYRAEVVRLLRLAIEIEQEFLSDTFLGATSMLLVADILSTRLEWREIHRMVRKSIIRRGGIAVMLFGKDKSAPEVPTSLRKYLAEQVAFLELMAAYVCLEVPLLMLGDMAWFDMLGELAIGDETAESIEATFGVHRSIFHLATSTAIYLGRAARDRTNEYYLLSPPSSTPHPLPPQTTESGQKVLLELQTWRASALPTLSNALDPRTTTGSMAYWHACVILLLRDLEGRDRGDEKVQESARELVRLGREAGDKVEFMMWGVAVLTLGKVGKGGIFGLEAAWSGLGDERQGMSLTLQPLMVASSVLLDPTIRSSARELYKTFQYQCCFEAEGALRVVEEVWKRVDEGRDEQACGWREVMLEMGIPLLLG